MYAKEGCVNGFVFVHVFEPFGHMDIFYGIWRDVWVGIVCVVVNDYGVGVFFGGHPCPMDGFHGGVVIYGVGY